MNQIFEKKTSWDSTLCRPIPTFPLNCVVRSDDRYRAEYFHQDHPVKNGEGAPVTMYLMQLCDGNRMYILGANLLAQLEGTHLVLDELVIESPAQ